MMTYADVRDAIGPADEATVAEIVRTGASRAELAEALAWIGSDEALVNDHRSPPKGTVAALVEILSSEELDDDDPRAPDAGPPAYPV